MSLAVWHRQLVQQGARNPLQKMLLCLLLPPSLLFGLLGWLRGKAYDLGMLPSYRAAVPVVSVGNLTAGGTGKTPVVDLLLREFQRQGKRPAVVSRGYGGQFAGDVGIVCAGKGPLMTAAEAGDEPCLLARRNPQVLVLIARKRRLAVAAAVTQGAEVVILDDGFQHRAVARDADLVLLDAKRPFGNGLPLPAGLLREFPAALKRADLLLLTRADGAHEIPELPRPSWRSRHQLAEIVRNQQAEEIPLAALRGKRLLAFSGIAEPGSFFASLELQGMALEKRLPLADHARYDAGTLAQIWAMAQGMDGLLTTEKDAVKLAGQEFPCPCYQVPMQLVIDDGGGFFAALTDRLWSKT